MKYDYKAVEAKWQKVWEDEKTFHVEIDHKKPKFYALVEFPYPSGAGLHVGHPHMQAGTRRIGELHQGIELGFGVVDLNMEGLFVLPHLLPLGFNSLVIVFHVCNQLQTFLLQIPRSE